MAERIPPELLARVRAFRKQVDGADEAWLAMQLALDEEMIRRIRGRRKLSFRPEDGIDMERRWRTASLTQFGQKPFVEWAGTRKLWHMREVRLMGSKARCFSWDDDEYENSVDLVKIDTRITPRKAWNTAQFDPFEQDFTPVIMFSEHALLRFFQRAFHASEALLVDACWEMFTERCWALLTDKTKDEQGIPVQSGGGAWFGRRIRCYESDPGTLAGNEDRRPSGYCFAVRTFFTAD